MSSKPVVLSAAVDIPALLPSWQRSLRAARRSPRTIQSYTEAAEQLSDFFVRRGMPVAVESIRREHVESFIEDLDSRFRPATVVVRYKSLKQLFKWLIEEGEITSNPMERMRLPSVPEEPPEVLSTADLKALLKACEGTTFTARRDLAIVRVFIDTGARLSEVTNLKMDDVDLDDQSLRVTGKGSRVRVLPIGAKANAAIDRYVRVRRSDDPHLWIGAKGRMGRAGSRRCSSVGRAMTGSTT